MGHIEPGLLLNQSVRRALGLPTREDDLEQVGLESRTFGVEWLVVMRSRLQRPAPVYEAIATFPLGSAVGGR